MRYLPLNDLMASNGNSPIGQEDKNAGELELPRKVLLKKLDSAVFRVHQYFADAYITGQGALELGADSTGKLPKIVVLFSPS